MPPEGWCQTRLSRPSYVPPPHRGGHQPSPVYMHGWERLQGVAALCVSRCVGQPRGRVLLPQSQASCCYHNPRPLRLCEHPAHPSSLFAMKPEPPCRWPRFGTCTKAALWAPSSTTPAQSTRCPGCRIACSAPEVTTARSCYGGCAPPHMVAPLVPLPSMMPPMVLHVAPPMLPVCRDLRANKMVLQFVDAHSGPVTSVSFHPDG